MILHSCNLILMAAIALYDLDTGKVEWTAK
jgi:hypothetical protein